MTFDVVIIGGGIVGTSLACWLGASASVAVLEAEARLGHHATGRSAALFSGAYGSEFVWRLSRCARPFLEAPPEGFADGPLLKTRGALYIAAGDAVEGLSAFHAHASRLVPHLEFGDRAFVHSLVPALRAEFTQVGLLDRAASDIDVARLHDGYVRQARAVGAQIFTDVRVDTMVRAGGRWEVQAGSDRWTAPIVVNAAGAWADEVATAAGAAPVGLAALRRTMITTPAPDAYDIAAWPLVTNLEESFYFKPDAGRLMVSPGDETPVPPCDAAPEELDVAMAADRLQTLTDIPVRRILSRWAGLRTFARDRLPVLGFDDAAPGFFWLAGLGGYGVQTSPALGRLAAALIAGGPLPADIVEAGIDPAALSALRFRTGG